MSVLTVRRLGVSFVRPVVRRDLEKRGQKNEMISLGWPQLLKMPSKWENCAHNGLICFFQHNYISTFEQWLWDRVCVLSTWFGDIWGSRMDLYIKKRSRSFYFKLYSLRLLTPRPMQYRVPAKLRTEMYWQYWPSPLCKAATKCAFWSRPCESAGCRRYSYNVSWYFVFKVVRYAAHREWYSFAAEVHDFPHW